MIDWSIIFLLKTRLIFLFLIFRSFLWLYLIIWKFYFLYFPWIERRPSLFISKVQKFFKLFRLSHRTWDSLTWIAHNERVTPVSSNHFTNLLRKTACFWVANSWNIQNVLQSYIILVWILMVYQLVNHVFDLRKGSDMVLLILFHSFQILNRLSQLFMINLSEVLLWLEIVGYLVNSVWIWLCDLQRRF